MSWADIIARVTISKIPGIGISRWGLGSVYKLDFPPVDFHNIKITRGRGIDCNGVRAINGVFTSAHGECY